MTAACISVQSRRRAAAALAAVAVGVAALLTALQSGASAAVGPAFVEHVAAPVTTTAGKLTLTVDPAGGLTTGGATLKVTGSGFDTGTGIYVAICHADGKAPASLQDCVGGAIPTANQSKSWAHVGATQQAPAGGPVVAPWGAGGTFSVQLVLPASNSASDALDCSRVPCAVYTAPDTGRSTAENLSIPLVFAAPVTTASTVTSSSTATTSSTTTSSTTTSSTTSSPASSSAVASSSVPQFSTRAAVVPTTAAAKSIRFPDIAAGGAQEVLFAGFTKNEPVTVTLYSAPRQLPATRADQDGVVKVDFTVPADLLPGTHLLRVVGQTSKMTGVASFQVTAPVVSSAAVAAPSAPVSTSVAPSSAPVSSAVVAIPVSSVSSPASPVSSVPVSSGAAAVAPPTSAGRVVWPWYALGALLLLLAGVVAYLLNRRFRLAVERRNNDLMLADAAAAERERNLNAIAPVAPDASSTVQPRGPGASPTVMLPPAGGYTGYHPGEHGLLSGRDHPDSPGLLSGTGQFPSPPDEQLTTFLPGEPTTFLPGSTTALPGSTAGLPGGSTPGVPGGSTAAQPGEPVTGQSGEPASGGPPTGWWRPDFDQGDDLGDAHDSAGEGDPSGPPDADGSDGPPDRDDPAGGGRHRPV